MKKQLKLALIATTSLVVASGVAIAQGGPKDTKEPRGQRGMEYLDKDQSGSVTLEEYTQVRLEHFERMDENGDGVIEREEMEAMGGDRARRFASRMIERLDADDSGAVERAEFEARVEERFTRMDGDSDGEITSEEFAEGRVRGPRHGMGENRRGGRGDRQFGRLDTDSDGEVSTEEFLASRAPRFERIDADGDGNVTEAEIDAALQARVERMKERMLARLDTDEDGTISKSEFDTLGQDRFSRLDKNDDGTITREEMRGGRHHGQRGGMRGDGPRDNDRETR